MSAVSSGVEGLEGEVVDDEQVDAQQFAHLVVVAVVEPAGAESFEEQVAAFEVDGEAAADGGVSEGGGDEGLADPDGSHDHGVVAGPDEAKRSQLVPGGVVVADLGGVVPAVHWHRWVSPAARDARLGGAGFAAGDFVAEDEFEELGVTEAAAGGEGEAFGEGVEAAAEFTLRSNAFNSVVTVGALIGSLPPFRRRSRSPRSPQTAATRVAGYLGAGGLARRQRNGTHNWRGPPSVGADPGSGLGGSVSHACGFPHVWLTLAGVDREPGSGARDPPRPTGRHHDSARAARRVARRRPLAHPGRAVLLDVAGRPRRDGHQGRESRRRRHPDVEAASARRRGDVLPVDQPQQAVAGARLP